MAEGQGLATDVGDYGFVESGRHQEIGVRQSRMSSDVDLAKNRPWFTSTRPAVVVYRPSCLMFFLDSFIRCAYRRQVPQPRTRGFGSGESRFFTSQEFQLRAGQPLVNLSVEVKQPEEYCAASPKVYEDPFRKLRGEYDDQHLRSNGVSQ